MTEAVPTIRFDRAYPAPGVGDFGTPHDAGHRPGPLATISRFGADVRLEHARISLGTRHFDVFHTDPQDHIFKIVKNSRSFYEAGFLYAIAKHLKPGDLVVDAGANIGNHTLFFAGALGCRVTCFEPGPLTVQLLQHNVAANNLASRVEIWPFALAETSAQFASKDAAAVQQLGLGALTLRPDAGGEMRGIPLDSVPFDQRIKLLKIDVEGMELELLRGARETLLRDRPVICVECDDLNRFDQLFDYLCGLGFLAIDSHNYTATHVFVPVDNPSVIEASLSRQMASRYISHARQIHALEGRLANVENLLRRIQFVSRPEGSPQ
ncbi:FkbM family methyltransferase [Flaviflagellibacter deserti]|uniref:FkbM family methyltransferase n=1 Tax=Flaviflagellibacter deserti TaxID=2267266 RepID=A0ABV9Z6H6_9HYPH